MKQKTPPSVRAFLSVLLIAILAASSLAAPRENPQWAGRGGYRFLVEVAPVELTGRSHDQMPAEIVIDLADELKKIGLDAPADIASLQIIRFDPLSGEPLPYDDYEYARSPYDRPFRWYDDAITYDFPEFSGVISSTKGEIRRRISPRLGYMYNALGDWRRGHLAWVHTQQGDTPSYYAIYFDTLPPGSKPQQVPPRGWIGDGLPRHDQLGASTTAAGHTNIDIHDWNHDGLFDIVFGEQYGQLSVLINTGKPAAPEFAYSKLLFDAEGLPIDLGMHAAPLVIDWDNDGAEDLLVGAPIKVGPIDLDPTENVRALQGARTVFAPADFDNDHIDDLVVGDTYGIIRYYRNIGAGADPCFALPIEIANLGQRLLVSATDWNNDRRMDVIAGSSAGKVRVFINDGIDGAATFQEGFDPQLPPAKQPRVIMVDLDRDGDEDLFVPSIQGSLFIDRSFLRHGYAPAQLIKFQRHQANSP